MKHFIPIIILGTSLFTTCSPPPEVHPLSIGDQMPAISATISINGKSSQQALDNSREKLIILEFINTWCSVCLQSVQHLEELQKQFPNDLSIILVTQQKDSLVQTVANTHNWSLPVITGDTTLSNLFPYRIVPHQVWIKDREVVAITDWQYANEENIRKLLAGQQVKTNLKKEGPFDFSKSLIANGVRPYYQSAITPRISIGSGIRKSGNHFLVYNADVRKLYRIAYGMPAFPAGAYVHTEVSDSLAQLMDGPNSQITGHYQQDSIYLAWRDQYTFCYNLVYPEGTTIKESQLQQQMKVDLNHFFRQYLGITASLERKPAKCLALTTTDNKASFHTRGGKPSLSRAQEDYQITNQPISLLIGQIAFRHHQLGMPVINATGYTGNVDLKIKGGLGDLKNVNKGLQQYGLRFVEQDHEIELVILKETPPDT